MIRRSHARLALAALLLASSLRAEAEQHDPARAATTLDLGRITWANEHATAAGHDGSAVALTLDAELDAAAQQLLAHARPADGAVIVTDVRSGKILVWAEKRQHGAPGSVITTARAPAASVFKLVTTAALFEMGGVHPNDRVCIAGGMHSIEREQLEPARGDERRCAPFAEALGHSRNAVYAQLATRRLTREDLLATAERIGFNRAVPFDWGVDFGHLEVPYNDLEFARAAAGFRGSTLSPLGAAQLASVIARGGLSRPLRLIDAGDAQADDGEDPVTRVLGATTAWRLTRMMEVTVHSGTSRPAFTDENGKSFLPGVRVAGKTGTLRSSSERLTTSWFIGFAPSRKPEIAISVLLQNRDVWRERAAEVARDVLRVYFHRQGLSGVSDPRSQKK